MATFYICLVYPFYAHTGIPDVGEGKFFVFCFIEVFMLIELLINFVL